MDSLMRCAVCKVQFDTLENKPIILPCFHSVCASCYKIQQNPEEDKAKCPIDQTEYEGSPNEIPYNQYVLKYLRPSPSIHCDLHFNSEIKFYDCRKEQYLCEECALQYSEDQYEYLSHFNKDDAKNICYTIKQDLNNLAEQIKAKQRILNEFEKDQVCLNQEQLSDLLDSSIQLLTKPYLNQLPFSKDGTYQDNFLTQSELIKNSEDIGLLRKWLSMRLIQTNLIYRGSRDGFSAQVFHAFCDNQGMTLSIIESENNHIFGVFASVSLDGLKSQMEYDDQAFIFSITHKTKHEQVRENHMALIQDHQSLLKFSTDINICNDCNLNRLSKCDLGRTYNSLGLKYQSDKAKSYLAGSYNFKVKEIEVFQVKEL